MNANAELLNFIYQNSQMGVDSLNQILSIIESSDFKNHLIHEQAEYKEIHEKAKQMLNQNGYDEKGISTLNKITSYLMINIKTMSDHSPSHIAEMLIQGSNMGMIDATKQINQYEETAEMDIISLMKRLMKFEEKNIEQLKTFL